MKNIRVLLFVICGALALPLLAHADDVKNLVTALNTTKTNLDGLSKALAAKKPSNWQKVKKIITSVKKKFTQPEEPDSDEDFEMVLKEQTVAGVKIIEVEPSPKIKAATKALFDDTKTKLSTRLVYKLDPASPAIFAKNKISAIKKISDIKTHPEYRLGFVIMAEQQILSTEAIKNFPANYSPVKALTDLLSALKGLEVKETDQYYQRLNGIKELWEKRAEFESKAKGVSVFDKEVAKLKPTSLK